ncbi:PhoPQ-activated pathogenicity-like protein PqaA type [bacterium]|nr:PhoPQ-activated pathogenicity-like protein PqaA type [bacterium]
MKKLVFFILILGVTVMAAKNNYSLKGDEIFQYISKNEPDYSWKLIDSKTNDDKSVVYEIILISQKWRDIVWSHRLKIYIPNNIDKKNNLALFMISGSSSGKDQLAFAAAVANGVGAPAALLLDVPNQPLYEGLTEDALIAATFMEFITNGHPSDLLLFPMAKSVVKGMDAVTDFCKKDLKLDINEFITCGASKRGWTTFLSGVVDKRVKAIIPIVYDNLNLGKQMEMQLSDFGEFSEQIADYTKLGIPEMMLSNVPNAVAIGKLVDPYAYIEKLKMPKLLVIGANDQYWPINAINVYYDELPGKTYVHYVPNAGHGLGGKYNRVASAVAKLFLSQQGKTKMPETNAEYSNSKNIINVKYTTSAKPEKVLAWYALSKTKDFRKSEWLPVEMKGNGKKYSCNIKKPCDKTLAVFTEGQFKDKKIPYILSNKVKIF